MEPTEEKKPQHGIVISKTVAVCILIAVVMWIMCARQGHDACVKHNIQFLLDIEGLKSDLRKLRDNEMETRDMVNKVGSVAVKTQNEMKGVMRVLGPAVKAKIK